MFLEKLGTTHSLMQHQILEVWNFWLHCCENLKTCTVFVTYQKFRPLPYHVVTSVPIQAKTVIEPALIREHCNFETWVFLFSDNGKCPGTY